MSDQALSDTATEFPAPAVDVVVVGAGFSGLYALYRMRELGLKTVAYEAGSGVGGTWFWNRYPGARVDVPSLDYSFSFSEEIQQEWEWTERYATQPELERYVNYVTDRLDLRKDIVFNTNVTGARFDEDAERWIVETDQGSRISAQFLILATGAYSIPVKPDIPGIDTFKGQFHFTARWPSEPIDYTDLRVGVVGTGSSGMQTVTALAEEPLNHLYVFQRTANWGIAAQNWVLSKEEVTAVKKDYANYRETARNSGLGIVYPVAPKPVRDISDSEFQEHMDALWAVGGPAVGGGISDLILDEGVNARVAEYLRNNVRSRVNDPDLAETLCAKGHFIGSRRNLNEIDYYEVFNRDNVTLVDVSANRIEIVENGIIAGGKEYLLDLIAFATGFDTGSGGALRINPVGRRNIPLSEKWKSGPRTHLGLMTDDFPNMFMIAQTGSPGVRSHMMVSLEHHVEWVSSIIESMLDKGFGTVTPRPEAVDAWSTHVQDVAMATLVMRDKTPYNGANIDGKPTTYLAYLGGVGNYRKILDAIQENGYEGFLFGLKRIEPPRRHWNVPSLTASSTGTAKDSGLI
jgi:cation diffusion facilitator CzcD-associated flavoprotein CzcO